MSYGNASKHLTLRLTERDNQLLEDIRQVLRDRSGLDQVSLSETARYVIRKVAEQEGVEAP